MHSALQADRALNEFITRRLGADGVFYPDAQVLQVSSRIMAKTITGLLFHEFGRLVLTKCVDVIAIDHAENTHSLAMVEQHRRDGGGWGSLGSELEYWGSLGGVDGQSLNSK